MRREIYRHKWMMIWENDDGTPFFDMIPAGGGTMIVPITDSGDIIVQSEYSPAYDQRVLFLPGGSVEDGEDPVESANRELQEEAGYKADKLDYLGEIYPFIKYLRAHLLVYLGRGLHPSKLKGDETTEITVEHIRLADIESLITSGRLRDSSVIAALYMARAFLDREKNETALKMV